MNKDFLKDINILYVEDEDDVRALTANVLDKFLGKVVEAQNGLAGLDLFVEYNRKEMGEFKFDLVITDINMPKMNGLEMIEKIHQLDYSMPVIITTAHSDASFLKQAIDARVRGYVTKPLKMDKLIDTIAIAAEPKYLKDKLEKLNKKLYLEVEEKTLELRSILDSQDSMILVINENKISSANKTLLDFFGSDSIDSFIKNQKCIKDFFLHKENYFYTTSDDWINEIIQLEDMKRLVRIKSASGEERIFRVFIKTFFYETKHYVVSFTDITEIQEYTYELQYKATHDSLTKLYNRQKFNDELNKEILRESRYKHSLSMLMFDIDDFKIVNDTFGHDVGDVVLIEISKILRKSIRVTDFAARWGGEEFMVLLPETPIEDAMTIAENIRKNVEDYQPDNVNLPITISIGISSFDVGIDTKDSLIKNVDVALYEAKGSGKNKVVKYEK